MCSKYNVSAKMDVFIEWPIKQLLQLALPQTEIQAKKVYSYLPNVHTNFAYAKINNQ